MGQAKCNALMHQSIPAAPSPPPPCGPLWDIFPLVGPGGRALANFALPGGRPLAHPGPPRRSARGDCTQLQMMHKFTAQIKRLYF